MNTSTSVIIETRHLIEPNIKSYLAQTLQKCHEIKNRYFSLWLNLFIFLGFVFTFSLILYYKYKGQPSTYEKKKRFLQDQQYVLSKIRYYHDEKKRAGYNFIDELPKSTVK